MIPGFGSNLNLFALNPSNGDVFVSSTDYSNGVGSQISMFGPPYTGFVTLPAPAGIAFAPACLMLDANGNLFVANTLADGAGNYLLFEYTPPYTAAPTALPTGVPPVNGVPTCAIDKANGDVFVGNASQTAMYAPPYTTETTLADGGFGQGPLTVDPTNGNLFMASPPGGTSEVDVLAPPYNSITTKITNGLDFAEIVALDPSENLFVANGNNTVTEYAPPYTGAPISTFNVNFTHSDIMALGIVP
jgi:hypothetical protein